MVVVVGRLLVEGGIAEEMTRQPRVEVTEPVAQWGGAQPEERDPTCSGSVVRLTDVVWVYSGSISTLLFCMTLHDKLNFSQPPVSSFYKEGYKIYLRWHFEDSIK